MGNLETSSPDAIADQIKFLEQCSDPAERNRIALVLADSQDGRVPDALIRMIQRPDLKSQRGTLVYALGRFDCSPHIQLLVQLIVDGNFEVSHEALYRLEEIEEQVEKTEEAYALLLSAEPQEEWRRDLIQEALTHFS